MEITKPNDIFVTSTLIPNVNVYDLLKSNILPDNTSFLDKESYRNTDFVKKAFTDESGKFDDIGFDKAYLNAYNLYSELSNDKFLKNNLDWDAYDLMRPLNTKVKNQEIEITKDVNPYKNLYGRTSFTSIDPGKLSKRELAQQNKIYDSEKGEFLDKTPNDLGLLGSFFNKTMVYATWDEDGYHNDIITGRKVKHKKGEDKLDKNGNFYIETLGNREIYGKQIVNPTDLITNDTSAFNKVDFFDSDGKNKSIIGTTFKIASEIAPFLIPGVNMYYGTFKMATGLASVLPTFYKSLEGILLGDNDNGGNETELWKIANKAEGFMSKYTTESFSEEGSESMWNYEQMGQLVTSIFSQIYEQRAAANLSNLFKKVNDPEYAKKLADMANTEIVTAGLSGKIANKETADKIGKAASQKIGELSSKGLKQSSVAKSLSLGYMALTSTADIYAEALEGGFDRRTAGIAALLAAGGQYSIMMNNRMSSWFLDDAVGFNVDSNRAAMRKAIAPKLKLIEEGIKISEIDKQAGKKSLASTISGIKKSIKNILVEPLNTSEVSEKLYKNSIVEGVEEVTEQMVLDASKGIIDAMSWLGLTSKQGSFKTVDTLLSSKGLENYLTNFVGGILGGAMFELNTLKIEPFISGKAISPETNYSIIRMVANGKAEDLKKEVDRMIGSIGNTELSSSSIDSNGEKIYLANPESSQASLIAGATKQYIDYIDSILNAENIKLDDESVIKKAVLNEIMINDLEDSGIDNFILSDFNILSKDIIELTSQISQLKDEDSEKKSDLTNKLANKKLQIQEILNGDKAVYYKQLSLFSLNKGLHSPFISLNVHDYTKYKYNVEYINLPDEIGTLNKKVVEEEFKNIIDNTDNIKDKMKFMHSVFDGMITKYSTSIGEYSENKNIKVRDKFVNILTNSKLLSPEALISNANIINDSNIPKYDLREALNIPLGDLLIENKYLNLTNLSEEEINEVKKELNTYKNPYSEINLKFLSSFLESKRQEKLDKIALKISDEAKATDTPVNIVAAKYSDEIAKINKLSPNIINKEDDNILPLDIIYLSNELSNESEITSETAEIIRNKVNKYKNLIKNDVKNIYISVEDILERYEDNEEVDISNIDIVSLVSEITKLKQNILNSETLIDIRKNLEALKKYIDSYKGTDLQMELEGLLFGINDISEVYINAEKLLEKEIIDSKLLDLLSKINIELYQGKTIQNTNILNVLNDEIKALTSVDSPEEYIRSGDIINNLKQSISTIGLIRAINIAMLDSSIDTSNPYGYNVSMINDLIKKGESKNIDKYKVINSEAYNLLNNELDRIENKLRFLIELSETNKSTIAAEQEQIKNKNTKLLLDTLTNQSSKISAINLKINNKSLLDKDILSSIMDSNKSDEAKLYDIEEAIYNSFNGYYKEKGVSALDELFEPFNTTDFRNEIDNYIDPGLTKLNDKIETLDYFNYLHTILSYNSKLFYMDYKNLLEKEVSLQSDKKAPFFGQEFSIKQVVAFRKNKSIMSHSLSFLKKVIGDNRFYFKNGIFVTGSGGVGKTSVVSNFTLRLDNDKNAEIIVTAPSENMLEKVKNDISKGVDQSVFSSTKEELFKKILGDNYNSFSEAVEKLKNESDKNISNSIISDNNGNSIFEIKDYNKYEILLHSDFIQKLVNPFTNDHDTVIYIDEISWINPLELQVIDALSDKEGSRLFLIGLGDELQTGFSLNNDKPYSLETYYYNHPPKLKGVIRAKNIHKKDNIETLERAIKHRLSDIVLMENKSEYNSIEIKYNESLSLDGDKFTENLTIDDLLKLDKTKEIVIVTDDGQLSDENKRILNSANFDLSSIKIYSKDNIQSQEFEQVIALYKIPYNKDNKISLYNSEKKLYTLLSRGKKSTLIVGNNSLLESLNINNVKKDTTSKVELMENQIDDILSKRIQFLDDALVGFNPESIIEEDSDDVKEISLEANLYSNSEEIVDNESFSEKEDASEQLKKNKDGDKNFLLYSFYNLLHARLSKLDNKLQIKPVEGNKLYDLQILDYIEEFKKENKSPEEIINEFIIAKNHILHNIPIPINNLFSKILNEFSDGQLVVKKIIQDEFTEPYGKQSHMLDSSGKERKSKKGTENLFLLKKSKIYDSSEGKYIDAYITLAALPDINNSWGQEENENYLKSIYNSLETREEVPVKANYTPLTGIRIIYSNGTSKRSSSEQINISAENPEEFKKLLLEKIPGLITTDLNVIKVFNENEKTIQETFEKVGYTLNDKKNPVKHPNLLRFRPFIQVSYIDPNNDKVSKILVLNSKKRSIVEAKKEYDRLKEEFKSISKTDNVLVEKYTKENFPVLISKWSGLKLLCDVIKYYESIDPKKVKGLTFTENGKELSQKSSDLIDNILKLSMDRVEKEEQQKIYENVIQMFEILEKAEYDLSKVSDFDKKFLLGRIKGQTSLSNMGLRLFDVIDMEDIENFNNNKEYIIYYNTLFKPSYNNNDEVVMDGKFLKYFELNCFLEPPIFKIKLEENLEKPNIIKEIKDIPKTKDIKESKFFITPFIIDGNKLEVPVDFSKWKDENSLHIGISSINLALTQINDKLKTLDNLGKFEFKNEILNNLIPTISNILNNPSIVTADKDIDANVSELLYDNILDNLSEELLDYLDETNLNPRSLFLTSQTIINVSNINTQSNAEICK